MSLWQRLSNDTSHAAADVYSHCILGDDTGKSVRIPFVYHPSADSTLQTTPNPTATTTAAEFSKRDIYNNNRINAFGLTFVEINGRAYVQSVDEGSSADAAGIAPHDAVQLAIPVRPPSSRLLQARRRNQENPSSTVSVSGGVDTILGDEHDDAQRAISHACSLEHQGARTSYDQLHFLMSTKVWPGRNVLLSQHFISPLVEPAPTLSAASTQQQQSAAAFLGSDPEQSTPASRRRQRYKNRMKSYNPPSIPPVLCWNMIHLQPDEDKNSNNNSNIPNSTDPSNNKTATGDGENNEDGSTSCREWDQSALQSSSSESSSDTNNNNGTLAVLSPRPLVLIFRRTRQRQTGGSASSSVSLSSSLSSSLCWLPTAFRLDDECDGACRLVQRLAPTADMSAPVPDTWEELVHDGTDWLLGPNSVLPPKQQQHQQQQVPLLTKTTIAETDLLKASTVPLLNGDRPQAVSPVVADQKHCIPLDDFERVRVQKLAALRSRMTAETMGVDRTDEVEAATVRAMIQKAVGLAFVRASKVVLGVSMHGGSGIVLARLSDGTWSAPSAIGMWGLGFGIQFGLEIAEYIFILQTAEAMEHFRRGGSYTVGGNMGIAVGGLGREAYGAASVGGGCGSDTTTGANDGGNHSSDHVDDAPQSSLGIAPIVAYAKSQGLYIGVSLEGSRIFTRDDINCRTYKFIAGRNVTANDILSGKVPSPPEAEELYAALYSVEFTHEMSCLPRPPEVLRTESSNAWAFDRSIASTDFQLRSEKQQPFDFFSSLSQRQAEECDAFEAQFKNFMYGGVSVQRLVTDAVGLADRTGKERRTLWLMLPEVGSLRLGFVSKLSDGEGAVSNKNSTLRARRDDPSRISVAFETDVGTVNSEDLTLDSALQTRDGSTISPMRRGNVQLSDKHSVALTDVTLLSQESLVPIKFKGEDKTQHLRVISIQDVTGASLLFLANNFREAELLVCGLKLLLERESARLGVRGGLPIAALGGRSKEGGMSPTAARGFREGPTPMYESQTLHLQGHQSHLLSATERDDKSALLEIESVNNSGMKSCKLGKQPGRDYMRGQADFNGRAEPDEHKESGQKHLQYVHDQSISRSIAKNVKLPLPLPLCRVLLLDSTSPVVKRWHRDRGDRNFDQSSWMFPTTAPRELERHSSEHQLIASGSMHGARRTMSFDRLRNGSLLRMSEEYSVDNDDSKKVSITITEKNPRRGFSVKVRIVLRACSDGTCDAFVVGEVTPVVKDVTNQGGVHKAFHLVMDEIKSRYTTEDGGLLSGFLSVVDEMSASYEPSTDSLQPESVSRSSRQADPHTEEKKTDHQSSISLTNKANNSNQTGFVSFEDMLKTGRESPDMPANQRSDAPSLGKHRAPESYPSKLVPVPIASSLHSSTKKTLPLSDSGEFVAADKKAPPAKLDVPNNNESVLIEVKPLPKIRLSLLPSPREEDEEDNSSSVPSSKPVKKKKKKSKSSAKRIGAERD